MMREELLEDYRYILRKFTFSILPTECNNATAPDFFEEGYKFCFAHTSAFSFNKRDGAGLQLMAMFIVGSVLFVVLIFIESNTQKIFYLISKKFRSAETSMVSDSSVLPREFFRFRCRMNLSQVEYAVSRMLITIDWFIRQMMKMSVKSAPRRTKRFAAASGTPEKLWSPMA